MRIERVDLAVVPHFSNNSVVSTIEEGSIKESDLEVISKAPTFKVKINSGAKSNGERTPVAP